MLYNIDSYHAYFEKGGLVDNIWFALNWFFVEIPFFILRVLSSIVNVFSMVLDQSSFIRGKQVDAFSYSLEILNHFGGKAISKGSLIALLLLFSAFYLMYQFFVSKKNFSKKLLHYLLVFLVFVFWFGNVTGKGSNGNPVNQNGGQFLVSSVSNISKDIKSKITSATTVFSKNHGMSDETSMLFDATVKQTFYFVNTGSLEGIMPSGEKLDESKLLESPSLDKEEKEKFDKERDKYLKEAAKGNVYFKNSMDKTLEKTISVYVGIVNLITLSIPVNYLLLLYTILELLVIMIIIFFPIILLLSFIPSVQHLLFKTLKGLMGLMFLPVLLGGFLSIFFYINFIIDSAFMGIVQKIIEKGLIPPDLVNVGIFALVQLIVITVVKVVLLKVLWKRRYDVLRFLAQNQALEMPLPEQRVLDFKDNLQHQLSGMALSAVGGATGNAMLATEGVGEMLGGHTPDRTMTMSEEHYSEAENEKEETNHELENENISENHEDQLFDETSELEQVKEEGALDTDIVDNSLMLEDEAQILDKELAVEEVEDIGVSVDDIENNSFEQQEDQFFGDKNEILIEQTENLNLTHEQEAQDRLASIERDFDSLAEMNLEQDEKQ